MRQILMVSPDHFDIEYVINPHMQDAKGQPKKVDRVKANQQWMNLKKVFLRLNCPVEVLAGQPGLPDMVFCANQTFPFIDESGKKSILLSRMRSEHRQPEVKHFEAWARQAGYQVTSMTDFAFEGCGDAIWDFKGDRIFLGYGFRTDAEAIGFLTKVTKKEIIGLKLISESFYHLDTCFAVLNGKTAAYVGEAFDDESLDQIGSSFEQLIRIPLAEAVENFAGNCFCPDGKNVILHPGATNFCAELREHGFNPIEVDTSEYLKSGGSVFCMKQVLFPV